MGDIDSEITLYCPKCGREMRAVCPDAPGKYALNVGCECGVVTEHRCAVPETGDGRSHAGEPPEGAAAADYQARHSETVTQQE